MATTWVLVAESSRARIYEVQAHGGLRERVTLAHPESRLHDTGLTSDLPGRSFDRQGAGRHTMAEPTDPQAHEAEAFAQQIAGRLDLARSEGEFDHLVVMAPPHFLGLLRGAFSTETTRRVSHEVPKNLIRASIDELIEHLGRRD